MKYYLDITLLPDAEINLGFLWQKVYTQCHLALVEQKSADNHSAVAIAFPGYKTVKKVPAEIDAFQPNNFPLGNKLRLLAESAEQLEQLEINNWLKRLSDYCHITSVKSVPDDINEYASFTRKQFNTSVERLARRRAKRKNESYEQAMAYYQNFQPPKSSLPYVNCKSLSGNRPFKLLIEKQVVNEPNSGLFNCYGLSQKQGDTTATVPCF